MKLWLDGCEVCLSEAGFFVQGLKALLKDLEKKKVHLKYVLVDKVALQGDLFFAFQSFVNHLEELDVEKIASIEIITDQSMIDKPQVIAYESLRDLLRYCPYLEASCCYTASLVGKDAIFLKALLQLLDQIELFSETLRHVKRILGGNALQEVHAMEKQMVALFYKLQDAAQAQKKEALGQLLERDLVEHIHAWRDHGIPALLQLQDC